MRICIIGAGVVGVASAYLLARRGCQVTLVERADGPADEASHANGGQLSYSYVAPLAGPGVLPNVPGWLLRSDSPLRFTPRLDPHQWRWCLQFMLACNAAAAERSTAQMLALSYLSRDSLHRLLGQEDLDFGYVRNGKLIVYRSPALLEKARRLVAYQAGHGAAQQVLSREDCLALEPALAGMGDDLAGAIHTPGEEAGDCRRFTQALFDRLAPMGVDCLMGTEARGWRSEAGRVVALRASRGEIAADAFVVAAGTGSRALLRPMGVDVPVYPLKGYSLSVPLAEDDTRAPAISVTDYERRIVYARIGGILRIAAMVDIGAGPGRDPRRLALLHRQVGEMLPGLDLTGAVPWAGWRPATPHGRPLIGRAPGADNLWLNLGQGALGFTLACGSAELLAAMMAGEAPPIDPAPFAP